MKNEKNDLKNVGEIDDFIIFVVFFLSLFSTVEKVSWIDYQPDRQRITAIKLKQNQTVVTFLFRCFILVKVKQCQSDTVSDCYPKHQISLGNRPSVNIECLFFSFLSQSHALPESRSLRLELIGCVNVTDFYSSSEFQNTVRKDRTRV